MIGTTIGKYRFVGQLGRGGMGTVYKAVDETLDREVAIKVLHPEMADAKVMKRFQAEATILAKLNHHEIAGIYELFRTDRDILMVMELVRGETLDKIADRLGFLPPERAAYLVDKVLSGLGYAHRARIVHCDMKPANIMVTEEGGVKIMDFGVARVRGAVRATADGALIGTPAYMPPEQVMGQDVDGRTDLYAVGIVFYRLLAGTLPFTAENAIAVMQKQISTAPPPLHLHRAGLPDWCEPMLQRALAKDPADRFQTAEEFREALRRAAGMISAEPSKGLSILTDFEATTPSPYEKTQVVQPVSGDAARAAAQAASTVRIARTPRRGPRKSFVVAGIVTLVAAASALVATILPRRPSVASPPPQAASTSTPAEPKATPAPASNEPAPPSASAAPRGAAPSIAKAPPPATPRPTQPTTAASTPTAAPAVSAAPAAAAAKAFAAPLVFDAKSFERDGARLRERDARVVLAEGTIHVQANDDHTVLHAVPYRGVASISYSRGRDPMWSAPAGPSPVMRGGRGVLGLFRGERHWLSLRTNNPTAQFLVLRFGNEAQAKRAIKAIEERTGLKAVNVAEP